MRRGNIEIVRAALDALNRGDWDGVLADADPEIELDWSRALGPYRGTYRLDQIRPFFADFNEIFESVRWEPGELVEQGDLVVASFAAELIGRDGIAVSSRGAWIWTLGDGKLVGVCLYQHLTEALKAAGLEK